MAGLAKRTGIGEDRRAPGAGEDAQGVGPVGPGVVASGIEDGGTDADGGVGEMTMAMTSGI